MAKSLQVPQPAEINYNSATSEALSRAGLGAFEGTRADFHTRTQCPPSARHLP